MTESSKVVRIDFVTATTEHLLKLIQCSHELGEPLTLSFDWKGQGFIRLRTTQTSKALDLAFRETIPSVGIGILEEPEEYSHDQTETA